MCDKDLMIIMTPHNILPFTINMLNKMKFKKVKQGYSDKFSVSCDSKGSGLHTKGHVIYIETQNSFHSKLT